MSDVCAEKEWGNLALESSLFFCAIFFTDFFIFWGNPLLLRSNVLKIRFKFYLSSKHESKAQTIQFRWRQYMHTTAPSVVRNENAMFSFVACSLQTKQTCSCSFQQGIQLKIVPYDTLTTKHCWVNWWVCLCLK